MKKSSKKQFIENAKIIYGNKYDYSLVEYINSKTKVKINCPIHGDFLQSPYNHLLKNSNNSGCRKCGVDNRSKQRILTTEQFIEKTKLVHGDKYNYSLVVYKSAKTKIKIICKKHGIFEQTPDKHLYGSHNCPKCNTSKGELAIEAFLINNNIKYISQYKFKDCKNKKELPFDFYIPYFNICIEYQGEQHYKPFWKQKLKNSVEILKGVQYRDLIKKEYCIKNNIKFEEITYKQNIELRLYEIFKTFI